MQISKKYLDTALEKSAHLNREYLDEALKLNRGYLDESLEKSSQLTKGYLDDRLKKSWQLTKGYFDTALRGTRDYVDVALKETTKEIISHFNLSQGLQNERIDKLEYKIDKLEGSVGRIETALVDYLYTDRVVHTLVYELKDGHHLSLPKTTRLLAK